MNFEEIKKSWESLTTDDDIDGQPSAESIVRADNVLKWAADNNIPVCDFCHDAMGGVAIWLGDFDSDVVWVNIMNSGRDSFLMMGEDFTAGAVFNDHGRERIIKFLKGNDELDHE